MPPFRFVSTGNTIAVSPHRWSSGVATSTIALIAFDLHLCEHAASRFSDALVLACPFFAFLPALALATFDSALGGVPYACSVPGALGPFPRPLRRPQCIAVDQFELVTLALEIAAEGAGLPRSSGGDFLDTEPPGKVVGQGLEFLADGEADRTLDKYPCAAWVHVARKDFAIFGELVHGALAADSSGLTAPL